MVLAGRKLGCRELRVGKSFSRAGARENRLPLTRLQHGVWPNMQGSYWNLVLQPLLQLRLLLLVREKGKIRKKEERRSWPALPEFLETDTGQPRQRHDCCWGRRQQRGWPWRWPCGIWTRRNDMVAAGQQPSHVVENQLICLWFPSHTRQGGTRL